MYKRQDYNAEGLLNYPVLADVGSIAINAGTNADGLKLSLIHIFSEPTGLDSSRPAASVSAQMPATAS